MSKRNPKQVRRKILELLYEHYQHDPMHSLLPLELYAETWLSPEEVTPAAFYLHERGLVELLVGFNPPNFDAIRISPQGIDLVEDSASFNAQFPAHGAENGALGLEIMPLVLRLVEEIEQSTLSGARRDWLIDDVKSLRDLLRESTSNWDATRINRQCALIGNYLDDALRAQLRAWADLTAALATILRQQ